MLDDRMKKYRFFLFDLDRTLWDFDTNAHDSVVMLLEQYQLGNRIDDFEQFYRLYTEHNFRLWEQYEKGILSQSVLRCLRFEVTFQDFGINDPQLAAQFGAAYLELLPLRTALMPHTKEVLEHLLAKGCRMGIISNGFKQVQYTKLERSGIRDYFERVFISEEVGVHKPHPDIFRAAVTAFNAKKSDTVMVGDDFAKDIEGAQVFGIDQFFYNPLHIPCNGGPTYESDTLLDLIKLA
ncbi:MAG: YjjG family noncanonical pyrimidine nucleotidase [Prevotellaceae bacterium]|jgi:putative hydrolase of the HAD superfamily|nr:YjjG family noncanonical pyrimidine nucleotidase [Prevotellaceae bacterium]